MTDEEFDKSFARLKRVASASYIVSSPQLTPVLAEVGEEVVRRALLKGLITNDTARAVAKSWLEDIDNVERGTRERTSLELSAKAVDVAERSARASERAARGAMWAALIALLTAALPLIQKCVSD